MDGWSCAARDAQQTPPGPETYVETATAFLQFPNVGTYYFSSQHANDCQNGLRLKVVVKVRVSLVGAGGCGRRWPCWQLSAAWWEAQTRLTCQPSLPLPDSPPAPSCPLYSTGSQGLPAQAR